MPWLALLVMVATAWGCGEVTADGVDAGGNGDRPDGGTTIDAGADDDAGNGGNGGNGPLTIDDHDGLLYWEQESLLSDPPRPDLFAIDPADPEERLLADPQPQDNARARSDTAIWRHTGNEAEADPTNLPQGVLAGEKQNGLLTGAHYERVVYNTADGELFQTDREADEPNPRRFSGEQDAEVVCAAKVIPDFTDIDASWVVYQAATDGEDCGQTRWSMAQLGHDTAQVTLTLHGEVNHSDFGDEFRPDWVTALRDADGEVHGVISYDGISITHHGIDGSRDTLAVEPDFYTPLGRAGEDGDLILEIDGQLHAFRVGAGLEELSATPATIDANVNPTTLVPEHAVHVGGRLYVADVGNPGDNGQILEIDPDRDDEVTLAQGGFPTDQALLWITGAVVGGTPYVAWAYEDRDPSDPAAPHVIRSTHDGTSGPNEIATGDFDRSFDLHTPSAPVTSNGEALVFYSKGNGSYIGAIDMVSGEALYEIENAKWIGQTWATAVPMGDPRPDYLFYFEDDEDGWSMIRAREATDVSGNSVVTYLYDIPDPGHVNRSFGNVSAHGFGPVTLLGIRPSQIDGEPNLAGSVWLVDARGPGVMAPLRYTGLATARPVSFF